MESRPPAAAAMTRTVVIDPVTRIEGHAKITLHLDAAGHLIDTRFHVVEYRGFEKFCEGRPFTEMAGITARICGICPVSHLLCAAKTGDKLLAVQIPRPPTSCGACSTWPSSPRATPFPSSTSAAPTSCWAGRAIRRSAMSSG